MKKRSLLLCLALVLSLTMAIGGTLAYLTDTETTTNVMVVGNVDIALTEWQRKDQSKADLTDNLEPFKTREMELYPVVTVGNFAYDTALWTTNEVVGAVDKMVQVENTGKSEAYFRTLVAFQKFDDMDKLHINWNETDYTVTKLDSTITYQNETYVVYSVVYNKPLAAGEVAPYSLKQVALDATATNETIVDIDGKYNILVAAQAIQTTNFDVLVAAAGNEDGQIAEISKILADNFTENPWEGNATEFDVTPDTLNKDTTAIENGTYYMGEGEYTLPPLDNKDVTFSGTKDTVIDTATSKPSTDGANLAFEGVTVNFKEGGSFDSNGFTHSEKVSFKDCTIVGTQFLYSDAEFINCTFEVEGDAYAVWTYGSKNATFKDCTFNTSGKAVLVYTEGETHATIKFENCTFNDDESLSLVKAAVEVGSSPYSNNTTYNLSFDNCTVNGFAVNNEGSNTGSKLWGNKNSMGSGYLKVTVTGTTYTTIGTAEELFAFAEDVNKNGYTYVGWTVKLTADIDLGNKPWTPIGQTGATQFLGTFDGQGFTISNLNIDSSAQTGGSYSSGLFGWIERHGTDADYLMAVKNLNIDGATVTGHHNVAVIAGYLIGTIENCHVTNAKVECTHANDDACGDKAGVIAGIAAETNAVIKGCTAADSTVTAGRDGGQIVGACIVGKVENCSATNVTVSATGDCTGNNITNNIIGRTN